MALKDIALALALASLCLFQAEAPGQADAQSKSDPNLENGPFPPDIKKIKERGKLIVGQYCGERPMFFMTLPEGSATRLPEELVLRLPDGTYVGGVDIAVAKSMANMLGVSLELRRDFKSFGDVILAVADKEVDLGISKLNPTSKRMQIVTFSSPYASFSLSLLVNRQFMLRCDSVALEAPNAKADAFNDAFNKPDVRIAAQKSSSTADFAALIFPKAKIVLYDHHEDALLAAKTGEVDAIINDDFTFLFTMLFDPALDVYCKMLKLPNRPYDICMAINPESFNLMGMANSVSDACRSRIGGASPFLHASRMVLKRIMEAKCASIPLAERKYPFNDTPDGKVISGSHKAESILSILLIGVPLASFILIWIAMSRKRKEPKNG